MDADGAAYSHTTNEIRDIRFMPLIDHAANTLANCASIDEQIQRSWNCYIAHQIHKLRLSTLPVHCTLRADVVHFTAGSADPHLALPSEPA